METNNQTTSAFCGNTSEMQNCRESPSVLKFLPAENRTGLLCSQRSKAEDGGCCWQRGRHGKGHGPKWGAASPGTSSQLWSCKWESLSVCIVQSRQHCPAHSLQCALKFSKLAELVCSWNPVENLGEACPLSRSSLTSSTSSPPLALLKHQPHRGCLHGCLCACRCVHAGLSCPSCSSLSVVCLSICTLICKTIYFC